MSAPSATILIVDDEPHNCKLLELLLRPQGYITRSASSGEEALLAIAEDPPDLILLDVMMPGMDGYEVARTLKADLGTLNIPIIMVTALSDRNARLTGLNAGVEEFLTKPVDRAELWLRVRNLLRLKAYGDLLQNHSKILDGLVRTRTMDLQRFRAAMEISGDAIALVDRTLMRYVDVNQTLCDLVGHTREHLLSLSPMELFSASRETLEVDYDAVIADKAAPASRGVGQYRHRDGRLVAVETRRRALRTDAGWVIVCTARDVTERNFAEQRLRDLAELRHMEAARHAVILNALPSHIALLDPAGVIVSVNEAWNKFPSDNVLQGADYGAGLDYLAVCDGAKGSDARKAHAAAAGIRSVLSGSMPSYLLDYACDASGDLLWFQMTVTPLSDTRLEGAVVMHVNITEQTLAKEALRESERRFSDLLDTVQLVSLMLDLEGRITYCNDFFLRLTGWRREDVIGKDWFGLFIPPGNDQTMRAMFDTQLADLTIPGGRHHESEIVTSTGTRRLIKWNNTVLRSTNGEVIGTASIGDDITERKEADGRIAYLNRVYAVLSGINTLIVRSTDRGDLFSEACKIAVEVGGYRMASIGLVDEALATITPVASLGMDEDVLLNVQGQFAPEGRISPQTSLIARAIVERQPVVFNDLPAYAQAPFAARHVSAGIRSMALLPLIVGDKVNGVLSLYSAECDAFHETEMKLLTELAGDIAYAIDHIEKQERLDYLAFYDSLTGLANRTLFLERLAQYTRIAKTDAHALAVFLVDLERFRNINDTLGRPAGDGLIKKVAEWLTVTFGDAGLLARVGADHFAIIVPKVLETGNVAHLIERTLGTFLDHPFHLGESVFRIAAKVGVAVYPQDGEDADALLRNAEAALKKAKSRGERFLFYDKTMTAQTAVTLTLENRLRKAMDNREFVLHYQPKTSLATGKLTGAEALLRWNDPRTGLVPPGQFIPVLEETGMIHDVGRWALRKALEDYLAWRAAGLPVVRIAVNVSPMQLRGRGFITEVSNAIGMDPHAPAGLELEITESLIMADVKHSIATLQSIRAMGVTVAIDDFGTGFSSLSYLAKLPVDTLKIDRSFVTDMVLGPDGLSLVSTIINLAHALKLKVVAEGVETEEQSRLLRLLGCDEMQGFLFSKAVPSEEFVQEFLLAS